MSASSSQIVTTNSSDDEVLYSAELLQYFEWFKNGLFCGSDKSRTTLPMILFSSSVNDFKSLPLNLQKQSRPFREQPVVNITTNVDKYFLYF